MRRSTSRIGRLPPGVLEAVNEKLYSSWEYRRIRKWLFEEVAEEDVPALGLVKGEKFSQVWLRAAKSPANAGHFCELALGTWYRAHHGKWVREKILRGESMKVVRRAAVLTQVASNRVASSQGAEEGEDGAEQLEITGRDACATRDGTRRQSAAATGTEGDTARRAVATPDEEVSIEGGDVLVRSILIDAISSVEEGGKDKREVAQLANAWARLKAGDVEAEKLKLKTQSAEEIAFEALGKEIRDLPETRAMFKKLCEVFEREKAAKAAGAKSGL